MSISVREGTTAKFERPEEEDLGSSLLPPVPKFGTVTAKVGTKCKAAIEDKIVKYL